MDDMTFAMEIGREAMLVAAKLTLPALLVTLIVGGIVSLLQSATQVQDAAISFVPKLVAVVATIFLLMPWFLSVMSEYTTRLVRGMGTWF